jgi:predicted nucleic acid-binding protein
MTSLICKAPHSKSRKGLYHAPGMTDLIPYLRLQNKRNLVALMRSIYNYQMRIDWSEIIEFQTGCLRKGINGIGVPDLLIAQNAIQNQCEVFSLDQHFNLMKDSLKLRIWKSL